MQAGRLLEKVDGSEEEYLIVINARTGVFLVDNFSRIGNIKGTGLNEHEIKKVFSCNDNVIVMHNHSLNGRPSAQDLLTYLHEDKIKLSLILCHDGNIYCIFDVNMKFESIYQELYEYYITQTNDTNKAKCLAMTALYHLNNQLGQRHKLFTVRRL